MSSRDFLGLLHWKSTGARLCGLMLHLRLMGISVRAVQGSHLEIYSNSFEAIKTFWAKLSVHFGHVKSAFSPVSFVQMLWHFIVYVISFLPLCFFTLNSVSCSSKCRTATVLDSTQSSSIQLGLLQTMPSISSIGFYTWHIISPLICSSSRSLLKPSPHDICSTADLTLWGPTYRHWWP